MTSQASPTQAFLLAAIVVCSVVALSTSGLATTVSKTTITDPGSDSPVPGDTQNVLDLTVSSDDTVVNNHDGTTDAIAGDPTGTFGSSARFYDKDGSSGYNAGDEVYLDDDADSVFTVQSDTRLAGITLSSAGSGTAVSSSNPWGSGSDRVMFNDAGTANLWESGSDVIAVDLDEDSVFTGQADTIIDADAAASTGSGIAATISAGQALVGLETVSVAAGTALPGGDAGVYYFDDNADGWTPSTDDIVIDPNVAGATSLMADLANTDDDDGDGTADDDIVIYQGDATNVVADGAALTQFTASDHLAFYDGEITANSGYDYVAGSNGEDIYLDPHDGGTYSAGPDTTLAGGATDGTTLTTTNPFTSAPQVAFYDVGTVGTWESGNDLILTDPHNGGTVSTAADTQINAGADGSFEVTDGAAASNNALGASFGFIDEDGNGLDIGDEVYTEGDGGTLGTHDFGEDLTAITVVNNGTLSNDNISSVSLHQDGTQIGSSSSPRADGAWVFSGLGADLVSSNVVVKATISTDAPEGTTLNFSVLPLDDDGDDTFQSGESGLFFEQAIASGDIENGGEITIDSSGAISVNAVSFIDPGDADRTKVELAFSRSIDDAQLSTGDFTVYDDDGDTVSIAEIETGAGADDGQVVLDLATNVRSVEVDIVNISGNAVFTTGGSAIAAQNVSARTTSRTLRESAGTAGTAYVGERVAIYADNNGNLDEAIEIESDTNGDGIFETFVFSGSTGVGSQLGLINTSNRDADHVFRVTFQSSDGASGETATLKLSELGLQATARSTSINDNEDLVVDVTSNAGNRDLEATLRDGSGDPVSSQSLMTDGSTGNATANFGPQSTGNYSVTVRDVLSGVDDTTATIRVSPAGDETASFVQDTYSTASGDIAEITLSLANTDTATLKVGNDGGGYEVNVTVSDGDDDGVVTVRWNTYQAGNTSISTDDFSVADGDDSISVESPASPYPSSPVDTGTYNLDVRAGSSASASAQGVSVVAVEERFSSNLSSWTMPDERNPTTVSDLLNASANGNLTADERIASGDWLVLAWETNGVEGLLDAQDTAGFSTGNATTQFLDAADASDTPGAQLNFTLIQTNPQQNRVAKTLSVDETSLLVIPDHANQTVYLLIDTGEVSSSRPIKSGDKFRANLTVVKKAGWQESPDTELDTVEIVNASIDFDRDPVQVLAEGGQTVRGTSNVAPGTTVRIQLQSVNASPRFIKSTTLYVSRENTWRATFDFSGQAVGDTFDATVSDSSRSLSDTADGEVVSEIEATPDGVRTVVRASPTPGFVPVTEVVTRERTVTRDQTVTVTVTQTPGQPGFGIAVAIVALLAAVLLALRRHDW